jgi:1-phosphatidylinositol-4-phosphate 5-kinase
MRVSFWTRKKSSFVALDNNNNNNNNESFLICYFPYSSIDEKPLSNGDVYIGSFKGSLPHGKGKYIWSDGTVYEGDWEEGKITGKGQILWSSGAIYEGDFSGGYLHGIGTFTGLDGSEYRGAWRMNIQHGLGMKRYSNLDIYEGSWKEGMNEGCGRYSWNSGNMYIGNWKGGKMCGRGVMKWENGDVFDGFWLNGLRHGSGVYRFSDGGYYFGMWSMGLKDGKGTFHPAGTKHPSLRKWGSSIGCDGIGRNLLSHSSSINSEEVRVPKPNFLGSLSGKMSISKILKDPVRLSQRNALLDEKWSLCNPSGEFIYREPSCTLSQTSEEGQSGVQNNSTVVYEREYLQGVLKNEKVRGTELSRKTKQRKKFHVKEAKRKSCVDIFEGQRSYYLMLNLQLGIR